MLLRYPEIFLRSALCAVVLSVFVPAERLAAQSTDAVSPIATDPPTPALSVDTPADALKQIESNPDLKDDQKKALSDRLERAKQSLLNTKALTEQTVGLKEMVTEASNEMEVLKAKLDGGEPTLPPAPKDLSTEQLKALIAKTEQQLSDATGKSEKLTLETTRRQMRLADIPEQLEETNQELTSRLKQLTEPKVANETAIETRVRTMWMAARVGELQQTKDLLDQENAAYSATSEILPIQQQVAAQVVSSLRQKLDALKARLIQQQREQAADSVRQTQSLVDLVPEPLADLAESNVELAYRQRELIAEANQATLNVGQIEAAKDEVIKELATSIGRVESVGLTDALGAMLRERRDQFEALGDRYRPNLSVGDKLAENKTESFGLEDAIRQTDLMLQEMDTPSIEWESDNIDWKSLSESDARWVLLKKHRKLLQDTLEAQNSLLQAIGSSDTRRRELQSAIENYNEFVNRRLFWTRSAPVVSISEFNEFPAAIRWIASPESWWSVPRAIGRSFRSSPLQSILALLVGIGSLIFRPRLRRFLTEQGKLARRFNSTFRPTVMALLATIVYAAAWPVLFLVTGMLIRMGADQRFAQVLGTALQTIAIFIATRELLREICRDGGLGDAHLGWSKSLRKYLRFHLYWYTWSGSVCMFLMMMFVTHPDFGIRTLGTRWSSAGMFAVIAAFHHVVLRKHSPLYADILRAKPMSMIYRRRGITWTLLVVVPLCFSCLAMVGYLDTVLQLGRLVQFTLLWLLTVLLILVLVYRWISIRRRDVARRQALDARQKRMETRVEGSGDEVVPQAETNWEAEIADLPTLDQQTRQTAWVLAAFVAIAGLVMIWKDILPAIEYFGELTLWPVGTGDNIEYVTLLDVLVSIMVILGMLFASRNFVSLLELVILSRTSLDSGARYAMSMLLRYVLFILGSVVVFNLLSVPVQQLGWLLAAVSVGIGFGLQEIIANFVCGIILLLERPVRVGDVVTIGDTTGTVSRIQMRATTVTNWDRKELVIPNKDLITEKVLNWSLSNMVNRMTLNVGVQYGADPDRVRDLLLSVVKSHPETLDDPAPAISLESFGESSLDFVVRFYLSNLNNRISVTHEINTAIARALDKAKIEIPFPQRDVHLKVTSDGVTSHS